MQTKAITKNLLFSLMILTSLDAKESISISETKNLLNKQTVHIIGVNEKTQWMRGKVKIKNYQSLNRGILEYRHHTIDLSRYDKTTPFIISSKEDSVSKKFVQKLKELGFSQAKYLKDGTKAFKEFLSEFRGIKLFSIFQQ